MKHIGVIVKAYTGEGLRGKVKAFFQRVDKDIDQGVHHEGTQKEDRRQ